jgi:hypothetical protein
MVTKAKIVTKTGTKITIEGAPSEIKEIIFAVRHTEGIRAKKQEGRLRKKEKEKLNTATDVILSWRESDYFNKPRNLLEIKNMLEEQGMIYPITTLSAVVLRLVRRRILGRIKKDRKWCYVKR